MVQIYGVMKAKQVSLLAAIFTTLVAASTALAIPLESEKQALRAEERTMCIDDLQRHGITKIRNVDLQTLQKQVEDVRVEFNNIEMQERNSPGSRLVTLRRIENKDLNNEWNLILLHKSLLALGYDDQTYQISTLLCWASFNGMISQRTNVSLESYLNSPLFDIFARAPTLQRLQSESSLDGETRFLAQIKYKLLERSYINETANVKKELFTGLARESIESAILNAQFELSEDPRSLRDIQRKVGRNNENVFVLPKSLFIGNTNGDLVKNLFVAILNALREKRGLPAKQPSDHEQLTSQNLITEQARANCVDNLLKHNIQKIGDISLVKLKEDLKSVRVHFSDSIEKGSGGLRETGVNYPGSRKVFLNPLTSEDRNKSWNVILLHESLGALGYSDENYEISTGVCWAATIAELNVKSSAEMAAFLRSPIFKGFKQVQMTTKLREYPAYRWVRDTKSKLRLEGGTATSTGGGGDIFAAQVKESMLLQNLAIQELEKQGVLQARPREFHEKLEAMIMEAHIEQFNDNPEVQEIQVTLDSFGKPIYWIPKSLYIRNANGILERASNLLLIRLRRELAGGN